MSNISRIEGYDEFGYKVWEFALPTMDEATANAQRFGEAMRRVGISADRAAENIARISELLARMECVEGVMDYKISSRVGSIETKAALLENKMSHSENRIYEIFCDSNVMHANNKKKNSNVACNFCRAHGHLAFECKLRKVINNDMSWKWVPKEPNTNLKGSKLTWIPKG